MSNSKIPRASPKGAKQMYVPGSSPEAQNTNLRIVVDELRAHVNHLKKELETEKGHVKELRREKQTEIKSVRDQEQQKATSSLSELRSKLGHEKQRELASLRESLTKQHDQEINRILKQKQELLARTQGEAQRERETHYLKVKQQVWGEAKDEVKRSFEMDRGKLLAEMDELRRGKRKLEEELNDAVTGDRQRAADLRRQWGEHQREIEQLKKDARRDIQRLLEELKSKDRVISELDKELGHKSGYSQRLQNEKDALSLSTMAESWDYRSSPATAPPDSLSASVTTNGNDEENRKLQRKMADLNSTLRKLEDKNKQLVEDKADLERKIRTSTEARNTTPLMEKNKRLLRKIKDLEQSKKKLDERSKALTEENQKLRSLKENMRQRLERENQSLRKVLISKERQQSQQGANPRLASEDREEELRKLRVEVQEQFLEIVELKQAALEKDRLQRSPPDHTLSRLSLPIPRPRSGSLSALSVEEEGENRSRSGSFDTALLSPLALSDCEDGLDENKELEERCTKLEWQLQDSKDQNELLEFRILELEEDLASMPEPSPNDDQDKTSEKVEVLETTLLEKDALLQSLQLDLKSQGEQAQQKEEAKEQKVSDLEQIKAHLQTNIYNLEEQLAELQADTDSRLAEKNQEKTEREAEITSVQATSQRLEEERDQAIKRLKELEECSESRQEEKCNISLKEHTKKPDSQFSLSLEENEQEGLNSQQNTDRDHSAKHPKVKMENSKEVHVLENKVEQLQTEKASLEAKLRDVEELVLNSDFASEDSLREKILELEQTNKSLSRQLKQCQEVGRDNQEVVERAVADAKETEQSLNERIQELQRSEQSLLDRVAQLEEQDNAWKNQVESLQDSIVDLEKMRQELKGKLDAAEEQIEELQVAEKFARDELSASHGASSFLGESLGLMQELGSMVKEDYIDQEDVEVEETQLQISELQEDLGKTIPDEQDFNKNQITELEKSETELMEKVESLEQANSELNDLYEALKSEAFVIADENESLKCKIRELEELQSQIHETVEVLEEAEKEKVALKERVEELEIEVELLKQDASFECKEQSGDRTDDRERDEELEAVREENIELSERLGEEHKKLQELREAHESLKTHLQNQSVSGNDNAKFEGLVQDLKQSRSEKAQIEEKLQTNIKKLESTVEDMEASKENLVQQLESSERELVRIEEVSSELHSELEHRIEKLENEKEELMKEFKESLEEKIGSSGDFQSSQKTSQQLVKEIDDLNQKLTSSEEQCSKLQEEVTALEKEQQKNQSELKTVRKDSMRKSLECGDSSRELTDAKKRLKELEDVESQCFDQAEEVARVVEEREHFKMQCSDMKENKENLMTQNEELNTQNEQLHKFIRDLEEEKEGLQARINTEAEWLKESAEELKATQKELEAIKEEMCLLREKYEDAEAKIEKMQQELKILKELETNYQELQSNLTNTVAEEEASNSEESLTTLKERIKDLTQQEEDLQARVSELVERQEAYEETIAQADLIVSETHQKLSQQNELLENKDLKIQALEDQLESSTKEELSHKMQLLEDTSHELQRKNEQLEVGEAKLEELKTSLLEYEEKCQVLEEKLGKLKQEEVELTHKVKSLQTSNIPSSSDVTEPKIERHVVEMQESENKCASFDETKALDQNEESLQQRIKEFEEIKAVLKETVAQADITLTETNQKLSDKTDVCERQQLELAELQDRLRQLEEENCKLETTAEDLKKQSQLSEETSREMEAQNEELCSLKQELKSLTKCFEESQAKREDLQEMLSRSTEPTVERQLSVSGDLVSQDNLVDSLRKQIDEMTDHEEKLQQRIVELEERQAAFEETLAQADVIMTGRESEFLDQISELQSSQSDLQEKLREANLAENHEPSCEDDFESRELSAVVPDANVNESVVRNKLSEHKITNFEEDVERLQNSENQLLRKIEDHKISEESLTSRLEEMEVELNLARDKIEQLERSLENETPDNDLQAQLEKFKSKVSLQEEANKTLKEEISNLKGTISELQDQLLQSPNQQISDDGFIKPVSLEDEVDLMEPQPDPTEEVESVKESDSREISVESLEQEIKRLRVELEETKDQLETAIIDRESLEDDIQDKKGTLDRLEMINKRLEEDIDMCMSKMDEQQKSLISQENTFTFSASDGTEKGKTKELEDTIADLRNRLQESEKENLKLQHDIEKFDNSEKGQKDQKNTDKQLKIQELEKSLECVKKELASGNSERVKTTNRLTEIVQYNREIKRDLRELEEAEKILRENNSRLKWEKDLFNEKLSSLGVSGEALLKEKMELEKDEEASHFKKETKEWKSQGVAGNRKAPCINEGSQTGPLTYIPNECLLATVLIEEYEMTLKEFLESLPYGHSPTDPILLKEGKHFFVEFNKLFIGKCTTPKAKLLRRLTRCSPADKPLPQKKRKRPSYPSLPGEECSKEEIGKDEERSLRPLEAASPTTKKRMIDEFVDALCELPWNPPPEIDWETAKIWPPLDEVSVDEDSIDSLECRNAETDSNRQFFVEEEAPPIPEPTQCVPEFAPPGKQVSSHKRTGSMSSDSLSEDAPPLPNGSPPRKVIRDDSLEMDSENEDTNPLNGFPPITQTSPKLTNSNRNLKLLASPSDSFRSDSLDSHTETDESLDRPPPLPKTSPPRKPNVGSEFNNLSQSRHSPCSDGKGSDSCRNVPVNQNGLDKTIAADLDSDASSTDTVTDHETCPQDISKSRNFISNQSGRKEMPQANGTPRPSSFDSGLDTISPVTEQEVESITAMSVSAGPDRALRLPKTPGGREGSGGSLAKPATPMWLKQMMDWQTAEKEKEETDLSRLKTSIDTMEKQLEEKEELVKELRQSEENLKKKLRDYGDLRPLKLQIQTKEVDLQDKERQVALLKSEVKRKEREVVQLTTKLDELKTQHIQDAVNQVDETKKVAEIASLKRKLEQSQARLKDKEEDLKMREDGEKRARKETESKEKELVAKEEALQKQSEELKTLEIQLKNTAQNSDQTDAPGSQSVSSAQESPESRSHDHRSHGIRSHDHGSHDSALHDTKSQELNLAAALGALTRENDELRARVERLASTEDRWTELQNELVDSRHSSRDRDGLERKLQMAEDMLREKTREELRLAEDNGVLEERVRHLDDLKKRRDGIEEDYRSIKEQFDDMEHKKNEAEIAVAPLKAKVSYLLQKCKERDNIIQRFASELQQLRPDRTEQLLAEVHDITNGSLQTGKFNEPLLSRKRENSTKGLARETHEHGRKRPSGKMSRSMNDVRLDDISDDDDYELGRLSTATRGRSSLDPLIDDLGSREVSLKELMQRTTGRRSHSHLNLSTPANNESSEYLQSVLNASPSKSKFTSRRDADSPSRVKQSDPTQRYNGPFHNMHDIEHNSGLLDLPYGGTPVSTNQRCMTAITTSSRLHHPSPTFSTNQQHLVTSVPYQPGRSRGKTNTLKAPLAEKPHLSPVVASTNTPSLTNSIATQNTGTTPTNPPLNSGHQNFSTSQTPATVQTHALRPVNTSQIKAVMGNSNMATSNVALGGSYGLANGNFDPNPKTPVLGTNASHSYGIPGVAQSVTQLDTPLLIDATTEPSTSQQETAMYQGFAFGTIDSNSHHDEATQNIRPGQLKTHSAILATYPGAAAQNADVGSAMHYGVAAGRVNGEMHSQAQPNVDSVNSTVFRNGVDSRAMNPGTDVRISSNGKLEVNGVAGTQQKHSVSVENSKNASSTVPYKETLSGHVDSNTLMNNTLGVNDIRSTHQENGIPAMHSESTLSTQPQLDTRQLNSRTNMSHKHVTSVQSNHHTPPPSDSLVKTLGQVDSVSLPTESSNTPLLKGTSGTMTHNKNSSDGVIVSPGSAAPSHFAITPPSEHTFVKPIVQTTSPSQNVQSGLHSITSPHLSKSSFDAPFGVVSSEATRPSLPAMSGNLPLQNRTFATTVHSGNSAHGLVESPGLIPSLNKSVASPNHQGFGPTPQQQAWGAPAKKMASISHVGGFLTTSPTSNHRLLPTAHASLVTSGHVTSPLSTIGTHSLSTSAHTGAIRTNYPHQPRLSNGADPPFYHHNAQGTDEPDQQSAMQQGLKSHVNGRSLKQPPSGRKWRTPISTGTPKPPRSLSVSKVIGHRGAVLTWYPPALDDLGQSNGLEVIGYKIYVDGRQKQLVTNAHLTKALVDGINLRTVQSFGIQTVAATGQASSIITTEFEDPSLLSSWSDSVVTESSVGRGTVTSNGSSVVSEELQERLFMAVYNYNPTHHSPNRYPTYELAFEEGDIVTVYGTIRPDGFYQGKVRAKRGLVPSNFIEEISMSGSRYAKKKHSHSKSHQNGSGDTHHHRQGETRGSRENTRTQTKTPGKHGDNRKQSGSTNISRPSVTR